MRSGARWQSRLNRTRQQFATHRKAPLGAQSGTTQPQCAHLPGPIGGDRIALCRLARPRLWIGLSARKLCALVRLARGSIAVRDQQYWRGGMRNGALIFGMGTFWRGPRSAANPRQSTGPDCNVAGTGRRSAHSRAAAIDISAFVLEDGRRISVLSDWTQGSEKEREFLRVVHRSACKRFGTVLGPDYNSAHRDHMHLEQGDGSFCR